MPKRNSKVRPSGAVTELRRQDAIAMIGKGKSQKEVARVLGVTPASVCKNLKKLRETMQAATAHDYEIYRQCHLAILEQIETSLLENKVTPEVCREWRQIRADIATFAGLNAPSRSVSVSVGVGNEQTKGFYPRFARATMKLKHPESWARLWGFIESMPSDYPAKEVNNVPRLQAASAEETREL